MASGLSMPVGFKNSTDGNLAVAVNAMESARHPHTFLGIDPAGTASVIHTTGNPDGHVILRGGRRPNYDAESLRACVALLRTAGLPARVMVDCSHPLAGGRDQLAYGVSITDGCIDWATTQRCLVEAATELGYRAAG